MNRYILIGQEGYEVLKKNLPKAESPSQQSLWAGIRIRIDPYLFSTDLPNEFDTPCGIQYRDTFSIRYHFFSYDANDIDYLLYAGIIRRRREHPAYIVNGHPTKFKRIEMAAFDRLKKEVPPYHEPT